MLDMASVLRLIISGDPAGAVAALAAVGDASDAAAVKTTKLTAEQKAANEEAKANMASLKSATLVAGGVFAVLGAVIGASVIDYAHFGETVAKTAAMTGMSAEATSEFVGQSSTST